MKLEQLLKENKDWKDFERIEIQAPKGTKDLISKKVGRQQISHFIRVAIHNELQNTKN